MPCLLFFLSFVAFFWIGLVRGDLPIHALMGDVTGVWKFSVTKKLSDRPEHCGGGIPNRNSENLSSDLTNYERFLERTYGELESFSVNLTMEKINVSNEPPPRNRWTFLAVRSADLANKVVGRWTMVYDEGFEVRLKGRRYFGLFKYERQSSEKCPEPIENKSATDANCYQTDPRKIKIGWMLDEKVEKKSKTKIFHWGCFYAQKNDKAVVSSFVIQGSKGEEHGSEKGGIPSFTSLEQRANYKKVRFALPEFREKTKTSLVNIYGTESKRIYGCLKRDDFDANIRLTLPKEFTWGDPYNDDNFDEEVEDQRECGSCYAMSSVYCLEKRFEIKYRQMYKKKIKIEKLSYQSVLSCSPYNQGCDGGYPYLVGKHMYEYGVLKQSCMNYENNDTKECILDMGSLKKTLTTLQKKKKEYEIYYASDYNYVNGCYECSNEYNMMTEILQHGPIVAAINATPHLLHIYNVDNKNFVYGTANIENMVCDVQNEGFNGWQQTNHAVAIVGWGEHLGELKNVEKYWIVRNTWGKTWGYKGFMKLRRGVNLAGIETQAVYIDPDFSRGAAAHSLRR
ncbi:dipeptidyl aminopeptidase 2, putative [Plasmodium ovale]|uniref:Dipeptidyl peptidase 1 n=1 Tax=Plasmodium ovale TaxID=36330 RepID=A0A1C3L643_PLAOA|nr:dipeptidyl aminopeptidase 2, putative [Plasmodium ovale]